MVRGGRLIACLCCAALAGTYCIVTFVNGAALGNTTHPAVAGGMQWYVDQVLGNATFGSGGSYNLFYTDPNVIQASGHQNAAAPHVCSVLVRLSVLANAVCDQALFAAEVLLCWKLMLSGGRN